MHDRSALEEDLVGEVRMIEEDTIDAAVTNGTPLIDEVAELGVIC